MYDLIIVGAGPAGMTAAIYAARRKMKFLVLSMDVGGQMNWSSEVENYPGGVGDLSGIELTGHFKEHLDKYKIKITSAEVLSVIKDGESFIIKTKKKKYEAKAVLVATGKKPKKLGVPGEEKFLGKGLTYCATCDAPLYKGKVVSVIGGGNSGLEASLFLAKYAKRVYLLEVAEKLCGEEHLRDKVIKEKKIKVVVGAKVSGVIGDEIVKKLKYDKGGKKKILKVDGVFVEVGLVTGVDFVDVKKNKWKEIKLFRGTRTHNENLTSVPGIFAAGDCTDVPAKQIIVAAGEGAKAALAAMDYVLRK